MSGVPDRVLDKVPDGERDCVSNVISREEEEEEEEVWAKDVVMMLESAEMAVVREDAEILESPMVMGMEVDWKVEEIVEIEAEVTGVESEVSSEVNGREDSPEATVVSETKAEVEKELVRTKGTLVSKVKLEELNVVKIELEVGRTKPEVGEVTMEVRMEVSEDSEGPREVDKKVWPESETSVLVEAGGTELVSVAEIPPGTMKEVDWVDVSDWDSKELELVETMELVVEG